VPPDRVTGRLGGENRVSWAPPGKRERLPRRRKKRGRGSPSQGESGPGTWEGLSIGSVGRSIAGLVKASLVGASRKKKKTREEGRSLSTKRALPSRGGVGHLIGLRKSYKPVQVLTPRGKKAPRGDKRPRFPVREWNGVRARLLLESTRIL